MRTSYDQLYGFIEDKGVMAHLNADRFYNLSSKYGIDAGFALSIWALETGWGDSDAWLNKNNPAGIRGKNGYYSYPTKQKGLEAMFKHLKAYVDGSISYVGKRVTASEIRASWSETKDVEDVISIWRSIYD